MDRYVVISHNKSRDLRKIIFAGQTLYNNKEIKDLFVNVVDKIIEPMAQYKLSLEELKQVNFIFKKPHSYTFKIEHKINIYNIILSVADCLRSGYI